MTVLVSVAIVTVTVATIGEMTGVATVTVTGAAAIGTAVDVKAAGAVGTRSQGTGVSTLHTFFHCSGNFL